MPEHAGPILVCKAVSSSTISDVKAINLDGRWSAATWPMHSLQGHLLSAGRAVHIQGGMGPVDDDAAAASPGAGAEQRQVRSQVLGPDGQRAVDALCDGLAAKLHSMVLSWHSGSWTWNG